MNAQQKIVAAPDVASTLGLGKSRRRRVSLRNVIFLILGAAVLAGGYLFFFGGGSTNDVRYVTEPAKRGALIQTVTATGTVEPTNQVQISSELSGTIRTVLVDYNDRVTAGQMLAELNTDKLNAEVAHAKATLAVNTAQLEQAQATLAEARQANARTSALTERSFASQATRETAEANYQRALAGVAVARAQVEVAEADLSTAETNLGKTAIRSPINGVVMLRSVEPGQTVAASLQAPVLFTIAEDLASMQLEVDIDEADVGGVREGQSATFKVEAYQDRSFQAEVEKVRFASATINNVVTYTGVLSLDNSELLLRPGMTATADIVVKKVDDALLIPNAALRFAPPATTETSSSGGSLLSLLMPRPPRGTSVAKIEQPANGERSLYVLENGEPKKVMVRVGASDGASTEVLEGPIQAGTAVITDSVAEK